MAVFAAAVGSLVGSSMPARAASPGIDLVSAGCADLQLAEVERVLNIELSQVASEWPGDARLRAELTCDGDRLAIVVIDPVTDKKLSRTVPMTGQSADRDRTIALLVSQLFLTSWSELLLARSAALEAAGPRVSPAIQQAAAAMVRSSFKPPSTRWGLSLLMGPRLRDLPTPAVSGAGQLRPSLFVGPTAALFLDVGYERGQVSRSSGIVAFALASASLGAGFRRAFGSLGLEANLRAGAAYVDLRGNPTGTATGTTASGLAGEAAAELGPTLALGQARLGLVAVAGLTFPQTVAHVGGDRDVNLAGTWLGASLVASFLEGSP